MATTTAAGRIIVLTKADRWGNFVRMTQKTWVHITDRHKEMAEFLADIAECIEDPDAMRISTTAPDIAVAYETFGTGYASQGVRTLVYYDSPDYKSGTTFGSVSTAYPPKADSSSRVGPIINFRDGGQS